MYKGVKMLAKYVGMGIKSGKKIKKIRIKFGLTQAQLAKKAGVSISSISRSERGKYKIDINTICALSRVFNIFPVQLLFIMHGFSPLEAVYPEPSYHTNDKHYNIQQLMLQRKK
jgi:transcriptional regulator with XRE-family HTH domain